MQKIITDRDTQITTLQRTVKVRDKQIAQLNQLVTELTNSTSWRLTKPIRRISENAKVMRYAIQSIINALTQNGIKSATTTAFQLLKKNERKHITQQLIKNTRNNYTAWIRQYDTLDASQRQAIINQIHSMPIKPTISVLLPVSDSPVDLLNQTIQSVREQLYPEWELCIAYDASTSNNVTALVHQHANEESRIKLLSSHETKLISEACNAALKAISGEFVALLDHNDILSEQALFWVADTILMNPATQLIYSDEDQINLKGLRHSPYFKPDWNPELFLSHHFMSHLGVYRTTLLQKMNGFRVELDGAHDYDLALRCVEQLSPEEIIHIPRVLCHLRESPAKTKSALLAQPAAIKQGEKALNDYLARRKIDGSAHYIGNGYRIHYALPANPPLVSLIIPTRNGLHLIRQCVESILTKTTYPNYEILIIDNGSDDPCALSYFKQIETNAKIRMIRDEQPFNYSAINNAAVRLAQGSYIGLINNDIEVISADWLSEMMSLAIQPDAGAIGAKLWYPNDTLQHGGVVIGLGGVAGHSYKDLAKRDCIALRTLFVSNYSAVTAACLIVKKSIYDLVGGLNETELQVAFNDVDFCLKIREAGYRNIWTPHAELYHHESATRGIEDTPKKKARFMQEVNYMQDRWDTIEFIDPAYNPNLTLTHEDFSLAWPPRVRPC